MLDVLTSFALLLTTCFVLCVLAVVSYTGKTTIGTNQKWQNATKHSRQRKRIDRAFGVHKLPLSQKGDGRRNGSVGCGSTPFIAQIKSAIGIETAGSLPHMKNQYSTHRRHNLRSTVAVGKHRKMNTVKIAQPLVSNHRHKPSIQEDQRPSTLDTATKKRSPPGKEHMQDIVDAYKKRRNNAILMNSLQPGLCAMRHKPSIQEDQRPSTPDTATKKKSPPGKEHMQDIVDAYKKRRNNARLMNSLQPRPSYADMKEWDSPKRPHCPSRNNAKSSSLTSSQRIIVNQEMNQPNSQVTSQKEADSKKLPRKCDRYAEKCFISKYAALYMYLRKQQIIRSQQNVEDQAE